MKAEDTPLLHHFHGPKQFIIPVFQRDYSWGTKHCRQLWDDVVRVGSDPNARAHFVGSVVYIAAEETSATVTRWLLIDGQQRLATVSILLAALRRRLTAPSLTDCNGSSSDDALPSADQLADDFLQNRYAKRERRHKLHLRRGDQDTLAALIDSTELPAVASKRLQRNFAYFEERLAETGPEVVFRGLQKLVAVDVSLTRGQDDPQMIFESLNSTGLDLTQADLIRNFVLMRLPDDQQTRLYDNFWRPMEQAFGERYGDDFGDFVRNFLTLRVRPTTRPQSSYAYDWFRRWFLETGGAANPEAVLGELRRYAGYTVRFLHSKEDRPEIAAPARRLRQMVEVALPLVMRLYDCDERVRSLPISDFAEALELLESYVLRRSVCGMQTRSLGYTFARLAYAVRDEAPLTSLRVALLRRGRASRFPTDDEFREGLLKRDLYRMRGCTLLLERIENQGKERTDTSNLTIEHVLPQNTDLHPDWRTMLGPDWRKVQETYVHRLGNLTLTGYNPEYSDKRFAEKRRMERGFDRSPLRLHEFIRRQTSWSAPQIEERGAILAEQALRIWRALNVDPTVVRRAELEERRAASAKHSVESLACDPKARSLLDLVRPQILSLGPDVVELFGAHSISYHLAPAFFVEMIPRAGALTLVLNLSIGDCVAGPGRAHDATTRSFIWNASEQGGVYSKIFSAGHVPGTMEVVRQAYDCVKATA